MSKLNELLPQPASFDVVFNNGKKRTIKLRPYTLRDEAYLQESFDLEELSKKLNSLDPRLISKLVWRQMEPESRKLFEKVKAIDDNDNEVHLKDYEKFMEAIGGIGQISLAFGALMQSRGLNSVIDKIDPDNAVKKKKRIPWIMRIFSTK